MRPLGNLLSLQRKLCCFAMAAMLVISCCSLAWAQDESLADYARRIRAAKKGRVLVSPAEGEELLKAVDEITTFSSQDSGFLKRAPIKRKLIGRAEAEQHLTHQAKEEAAQARHTEATTTVLQKFGMLPADFKLRSASDDFLMSGIAGYYQFSDKTMYLLNWIPLDLQKTVMAHELTHALQDQNFNLTTFIAGPTRPESKPRMKVDRDDEAEGSIARRAVMEGQASLVGLDYILRDLGTSFADSARARDLADQYVQESYNPPMSVHDAPRILREIMLFPYREGLQFELSLLDHGGRNEAFHEAFKRPPFDTHQILQPTAYYKNERTPVVEIGDLTPVLGDAYEAYDSGNLGELDVQMMAQEFGRENDIYSVARKWNGGSYVAMKRTGLAPDKKVSTADLALVYVSRWKSSQAAQRFGTIYLQAMTHRLPSGNIAQSECEDLSRCPGALWQQHAATSEGPVNIELWPGNLLIITQSLDDTKMAAIRPLLLHPQHARAAVNPQELTPRLLAIPEIQALSMQIGEDFNRWLFQQLPY